MPVVARFDPNLHPRDRIGRFAKSLRALKPGQAIRTTHGVEVQKLGGSGPFTRYSVKRSRGRVGAEERKLSRQFERGGMNPAQQAQAGSRIYSLRADLAARKGEPWAAGADARIVTGHEDAARTALELHGAEPGGKGSPAAGGGHFARVAAGGAHNVMLDGRPVGQVKHKEINWSMQRVHSVWHEAHHGGKEIGKFDRPDDALHAVVQAERQRQGMGPDPHIAAVQSLQQKVDYARETAKVWRAKEKRDYRQYQRNHTATWTKSQWDASSKGLQQRENELESLVSQLRDAKKALNAANKARAPKKAGKPSPGPSLYRLKRQREHAVARRDYPAVQTLNKRIEGKKQRRLAKASPAAGGHYDFPSRGTSAQQRARGRPGGPRPSTRGEWWVDPSREPGKFGLIAPSGAHMGSFATKAEAEKARRKEQREDDQIYGKKSPGPGGGLVMTLRGYEPMITQHFTPGGSHFLLRKGTRGRGELLTPKKFPTQAAAQAHYDTNFGRGGGKASPEAGRMNKNQMKAALGLPSREVHELSVTDKKVDAWTVGSLNGKNVVVTGKLATGTRDEVHARIINQGGKVHKTMTPKIDLLIVGEKAGSKLRKARELGIPVMDESELKKLVEGGATRWGRILRTERQIDLAEARGDQSRVYVLSQVSRALVEALGPADLEERFFSPEQRKAMAKSGKAMPHAKSGHGGYPIETRQDLKNAIRAIGRAKNRAKTVAWIKSKAASLGALDLLPKGW